MSRHVLVARLDNAGDVLLTGPAVRAVAASADSVTFLAGPAGAPAAALLPGVSRILTWSAPWIREQADVSVTEAVEELLAMLAGAPIDEAIILTSFHQSSLPLALVLRLAGVPAIAATSVDHPGGLLDHRLPYLDALHEVEQNLLVAGALGHEPPPGDHARLEVSLPDGAPPHDLPARYVVLHPGASVPARSIGPALAAGAADALLAAGRPVVLTGSAADGEITAAVAAGRPDVIDLAGRTDLAGLARVLRHADAVVCGNTGPAHLAAAVGTPVVAVFAPVVAPHRWRPWGVPHRLLGDLDIECRSCRSVTCPFEQQWCVAHLSGSDVSTAVDDLLAEVRRDTGPIGEEAMCGS